MKPDSTSVEHGTWWPVLVIASILASSCGGASGSSGNPSAPSGPGATVTGVTVAGPDSFTQTGATAQFTATVSLSTGGTEDRTSTATWQSDNAAVATVSSQGLVTTVGNGDAVISATVSNVKGTRPVGVKIALRTADPLASTVCSDAIGNSKGSCLPVPDMRFVVDEIAAQFPGALQNSCQDHGGTWEFMDRVVDRLREFDTRWGYNWKRGVVGDPSLDVVAYHYGPGPDEGSPDIHAVDIINGHCGTPSVTWTVITNFFGSGGAWTGRGRF